MTNAATTAPPTCKVVLAGTIAKSLLSEVQDGLGKLPQPPVLVGLLANDDPAAQMYADWTEKTCKENGFTFRLHRITKDTAEDAILSANADRSVSGIIVYYPIHNNKQDDYLRNTVALSKDVEGLSHRYIFNLYQNIRFLDAGAANPNQKSILPCTPLAVIKILEYLRIYNTILPFGNRLFGHTITVINRSEVVGRPLAALLANDGACVYSVDVTGVQQFSRGQGIRNRKHEVVDKVGWTLEQCLPISDVVISGVPGDKYKVPVHLLRDGVVCVNFSSEKNFSPEVKEKASIYVPAIGKVTIAILLRNLLRLAQNQAQAAVNISPPSTVAVNANGVESVQDVVKGNGI